MLSQTSEHAIRALLYLAQQPAGEPVPADRIARALGAPGNYLGKTLQLLARRGEIFDLVTDQTSAHDPLYGYVPTDATVQTIGEHAVQDHQALNGAFDRDSPTGSMTGRPSRIVNGPYARAIS